ncbi:MULTISPECIES: S1C family serine protease [unclassified Treponema]|uniref:S1C family serine protease n=1 Tax=unclassified Treponema TaxID=2638727 RepID=UPI0020A3CC5E|nr:MULTISPECIES: S1C family serine protease [unclassified Treponema]
MNKVYISCFFVLLLFFSCTSTKEFSYVDYSDRSSVLYQVEYTEKLLKSGEITQALIRSQILCRNTKDFKEVDDLNLNAVKMAEEAFFKSIDEKNWDEAVRYFRSLTAIGKRPPQWTEERIFDEMRIVWKKNSDIPLLNLKNKKNPAAGGSASFPQNIDDMIKGTLTVWVDKGARIQKGFASPDIVIGSGFFIDSRGYFITNYHVIQSEVDKKYNGYSRLYIKSPDNPNVKIPARVVGWDPLFDLALVKTEYSPKFIFNLGSSKELSVGSRIYAIGSPAGLEKTLTSGIVSAKYRRLFSMVDIMQIDAAVNHGNSGGPIVDDKGLVQAVVFAGLERNEGLNFAIPVELLKAVLPDLYKGGAVKHSWLGCHGQEQKDNPKIANGVPNGVPNGVLVNYVLPDGPFSISGISEGTVIKEINDIPVNSVEEIQANLLSIAPETIVRVKGYQKNEAGIYEEKTWPVLCAHRPLYPGNSVFKKDSIARSMLPVFGFKLESLGKRNSYRVAGVIPGSFAAENSFGINDYIELNGKRWDEENEEVIHVRIYTKKVRAGYMESFMVLSAYLDNPSFF